MADAEKKGLTVKIDAVCAKMPEVYDKKKIAAWAKAYEAL